MTEKKHPSKKYKFVTALEHNGKKYKVNDEIEISTTMKDYFGFWHRIIEDGTLADVNAARKATKSTKNKEVADQFESNEIDGDQSAEVVSN